MLLPDFFLSTLGNAVPDVLEPGIPNARYSWTRPGAALGIPPDVPAEIVSISPHMHQRGRKFTFELGRDGAFDCQGHVERWNFNWQRAYDYTEPLAVDASSELRVSCEYDTSGDTQPVLPGWGTQNEMCELTMMLAFPPGVRF